MRDMAREGEERREIKREIERERETRHNNSPPTKNLRLRLGWARGGVEVGLG